MAANKDVKDLNVHFSTESPIFKKLVAEADRQKKVHLRDALKDEKRNPSLWAEWGDGMVLDYSRQKVDKQTMDSLFELAKHMKLEEKIAAMFSGQKINTTENRAVYHVALRSTKTDEYKIDGVNVVPDVHKVLDRMFTFAKKIRSGELKGHTGKILTDVICVGIGGSYLGPEFVVEALRTDPLASKTAEGRRVRFLANIDPIDVKRATEGLNPETTLVMIISKTFTTAETMVNARTLKKWLLDSLKDEKASAKHICAVSTNLDLTSKFGIDSENVFGFWDWVGGRFSVTSAVGVLPLSLQYGPDIVQQFLLGANAMDTHFKTAKMHENMPVLMGLLSVWNTTFLNYNTVAVLPYCQALLRFAAHIQQLTMESNGKGVAMDGKKLDVQAGEIYFGEPGTNGQHSFYQLIHQGRVVPTEFIGFSKSQNPIAIQGEEVSNHDELMSNFFAQPDALAMGKTAQECQKDNVPAELVPHKVFTGDRPSSVLLFPTASAFYMGALLSLYEHRTAVQGFVWGINSFDQWGVELGKVLAKGVRGYLKDQRTKKKADDSAFVGPTKRLMSKYLVDSLK